MPKLYVVATPIGNLEDVTLRALATLREVSLIAAEDTRSARVLLNHYGVRAKLVSYTEHNRSKRIPEIINALHGGDVALISDAGTPAISDPGVELVAAARAAGFEVVALPGASAPIAALSIAGLATRSFTFVGFLPRTEGELRRLLTAQLQREETTVAFESPQRLAKTLAAIDAVAPGRRLAVCRELTKLHEEVYVGTAADAAAHFEAPRGEIVIIIEGLEGGVRPEEPDEALVAEVARMKEAGLTRAQAAALLAGRSVSRRRLYELWLKASPESR
jgi:16S rRNA (cytidine1402-2'-O)-methyltransferase